MMEIFKKRNKIQNVATFCTPSLYGSLKCGSCLILTHSILLPMNIKLVTGLYIYFSKYKIKISAVRLLIGSIPGPRTVATPQGQVRHVMWTQKSKIMRRQNLVFINLDQLGTRNKKIKVGWHTKDFKQQNK